MTYVAFILKVSSDLNPGVRSMSDNSDRADIPSSYAGFMFLQCPHHGAYRNYVKVLHRRSVRNGHTVNETRTFFDLSITTSSNVDALRMTVSGGGGGLMLDLTPAFSEIL